MVYTFHGKKYFTIWITYLICFLASLIKKGKSHNQIGTANSALTSIITPQDNISFYNLPTGKRYIKVVFDKNQTLPKCHYIRNISSIFKLFRNMPVIEDINLIDLTRKLAMLMTLITGGQKALTIHQLKYQIYKSLIKRFTY